MSKRFVVLLASFLLLFLTAFPAFAHHKEGRVLGDATQAAQISFSEVTAGPGVILPSSPLFFIDKIYQQVRLILATTPEAKAKVRADVIGERMAEVRVMILRDNEKGLNQALQNLTEESDQAAEDLSNQANSGKNVEEAAKTLNETIKQEKEVLNSLSEHSAGSLGFTFRSAGEKVKNHKIEVEDQLPAELLQREIENELEDEIEDKSTEATKLTLKIERNVNELEKRASDAATKLEKKRLEAIKKAIEARNQELRRRHELLLKLERKKQEELKKRQEMLREKAKKAAKATSELEEEIETGDSHEEEIDLELDDLDEDELSEPKNSGSSDRENK